ncbi:hypothetical protein ROJ8625_04119 [Roseivivax jejudonensis]|uniref:Uncharacterized protein n=1 Tax=Roseivivax jejudonensis TaxID=1529041 RepID=A0A1X7AB04_9RHOB|nr:hypothetical protein ROJ8625_04119 [Roseivivax jejudonensis]
MDPRSISERIRDSLNAGLPDDYMADCAELFVAYQIHRHARSVAVSLPAPIGGRE